MARAREKLQKLQDRVASGRLKQAEKIGAAAERIMQRYHGYRYFAWQIRNGSFEFFESDKRFAAEQRIEGKYIVATSEKDMTIIDAVVLYKDLSNVEQGFHELKDVLAMRPIWHHIESRVRAHIFVAALALLVERMIDRRLKEAGTDLSSARAMQALATVRVITFFLKGQPERRGVSGGCPDARKALKALKLIDLRPPTPPEGEETIV
jgi:transposase